MDVLNVEANGVTRIMENNMETRVEGLGFRVDVLNTF